MGGVLLVAFGVASALHPANEKYLTYAEPGKTAVAVEQLQEDADGGSRDLADVTEGKGTMHIYPYVVQKRRSD